MYWNNERRKGVLLDLKANRKEKCSYHLKLKNVRLLFIAG